MTTTDHKPMRCYILQDNSDDYLCFGHDATSAAEQLRSFGVDPDAVSVVYGFPIPAEGMAAKFGREFMTLRLADGRSVMGREKPGDMA